MSAALFLPREVTMHEMHGVNKHEVLSVALQAYSQTC